MIRGITIKIKRKIETRKRRTDEYGLKIWNGLHWMSIDSLPRSLALAWIYGSAPEVITTELAFLLPGVLPPAAMGYPRTLPFKRYTNDNNIKTSLRGCLNTMKAMLVIPERSKGVKAPARETASFPRTYFIADEIEEALLRVLSKQYHRHVFINNQGRYGYLDETVKFIPVDAD